MMDARPIGDVAGGGPFEAVFRKSLEGSIEELLPGPDTALLLFSGRSLSGKIAVHGLSAILA